MSGSFGARQERRRPTRVVSVCVAGRPAQRLIENVNRCELVALIGHQLRERPEWDPIDAIVFPAGYFRLPGWYGPLSGSSRVAALRRQEPIDVCRAVARKLSLRSPACRLVVGVDTNKPNWGWRGDQLVVACSGDGELQVVRKIFPTAGDTDENGRAPYLLFKADADDSSRILQLANGERAALSACYDAFAFAELAVGPSSKRRNVRFLGEADGSYRIAGATTVDSLMDRLSTLLREAKPSVSLAAIHSFARPGAERNWQRHGLATASAALAGGLSVGAGHFTHALPSRLTQTPLAADAVPEAQLHLGCHRSAHEHRPLDGFNVALSWAPKVRGLVRLFEAG